MFNMAFLENIVIALIIIAAFLYFMYYLKRRKLEQLEVKYGELEYKYKSMNVKHGNQFESFVPFMENIFGSFLYFLNNCSSK